MAAPQNVYEIYAVRNSSTGEDIKVLLAKPLKDYVGSTTGEAAQMTKFKELFHLDFVQMIYNKDTGTKGLIAAILENGDNAEYHNIDTVTSSAKPSRRSKMRLKDKSGNTYIVLNDAGLNILPDATLGSVPSSFANIVVLYLNVKSAYYSITKAVSWLVYRNGATAIGEGKGNAVPANSVSQEQVYYHDSSINMDNPFIEEGDTVVMNITVENEEGARTIQKTVVTGPRVLWDSGRLEWHFSTSEPAYLRDITEAAVSKIDVYENDIKKFDTLGNLPNTVPLTPPQLYAGVSADYPTMKTAASPGWYYCAKLGNYIGEDYTKRAWYVDSKGKGNYYKDLTNPITHIYLGALLVQETAAGAVQYFTRSLSVYARIQGGWNESDKVSGIEVKVGVSGSVIYNSLKLTDRNKQTVDYDSNIGPIFIDTILTPNILTYEKDWTNLYFTKAQMQAAGGTQYMNIKSAVRSELQQTRVSITCVYTDGTRKAFEGQIHWDVNPIDTLTQPNNI